MIRGRQGRGCARDVLEKSIAVRPGLDPSAGAITMGDIGPGKGEITVKGKAKELLDKGKITARIW